MVKSITDSVAGVDACLLVVEAGKPVSAADRDLIEKFKSSKLPALLAINKIDCISDKSILMEQIISYTELFDFEAIVPVSATTGSGVNENNVTELMTYTGVHQVHSSCRVWKKDITTSNEYVDFSYAGIQEKNQYEAVDAAKVHRLAELC